MSDATIKRCACGAIYTKATWSRLPLCGVMNLHNEVAEIRNCPCGSSLALRELRSRSDVDES